MTLFTWHLQAASLHRLPSVVTEKSVMTTLTAALAQYGQASGVRFVTGPEKFHHHLEVAFGRVAQSRAGGMTLAQCQNLGNHHSLITFRDDVIWSTGGWLARLFARGAWDLRTFALHEIGHALGLAHVDEWDSVMAPQPEDRGIISRLSARDCARLVTLWGPAR